MNSSSEVTSLPNHTVSVLSESSKVDLSIVIPARDEMRTIRNSLRRIQSMLEKIDRSYEVIVAEDGSKDGTASIVAEIARQQDNILHIHSDMALGKGRALLVGLRAARGSIIVITDADLAADIESLPFLISKVTQGYDLAMGSRHIQSSITSRTIYRTFASHTYNCLVRLLFRTGIRDHQCGLKAFNRKALESIMPMVSSDANYLFDTEVIVLMRKKGYKLAEIPIKWIAGKDSKINVLKDGIEMGLCLIKLRLRTLQQSKSHSFDDILFSRNEPADLARYARSTSAR